MTHARQISLGRSCRRAAAVLTLSILTITPIAAASGPTTTGDWYDSKVRSLDSSKWSDRMGAEAELASHEGKSLNQIEESLRSQNLTAEQRLRLRNLAIEIFEKSPRAALGIQWSQGAFGDPSVVIGGTVPDFDAARQLKAGDRLLKISGTEITNRDVARSAIMSHDPGDIGVIQVLRRGETETFHVRMGAFEDLEQIRREKPDQEILRRARAIRLARAEGRVGEPVIATGLTNENWIALESDQQRTIDATAARLAKPNGDGPASRVRTGGYSPVVHVSRATVGMLATAEFEAREIDANMAAQVANIRRQIENADRTVTQLRQLMLQPNLDANVRRQVAEKIASTELEIMRLKASMPFMP